eukprot:Tbor_TRINITY_DN4427_c0_g1::TRINITY_DN4427_c0_g1_i1::g.8039::m.8039
MSSWVPATAWRAHGFNKRYGLQALGIQGKAPIPPNFFSSTQNPSHYNVKGEQLPQGSSLSQVSGVRKMKECGAPFIDLRDRGEKLHNPISFAVDLHIHDLISGASRNILPIKRTTTMVVFSDDVQRGVTGYNALRRLGYKNVVVMDTQTVQEL